MHDSFGTNWRMTEIQAAIGRIQLKKLADWQATRQKNAAILTSHLNDLSAVKIPQPPSYVTHAFYKYYLFIRAERLKLDWTRDRILETLLKQHIPSFTGSCSEIYQENAFVQAKLQPQVRLPVAKQLGETSLLFLVHPTLTADHMNIMGEKIATVIREASH